jgi:hypothetical protein
MIVHTFYHINSAQDALRELLQMKVGSAAGCLIFTNLSRLAKAGETLTVGIVLQLEDGATG